MRHRSHVLFTWINEMIRHPKILDAMEDLLGPDILCGIPASSSRRPMTGLRVLASDATYWGLDSSDVATRWIRDVAREQGVRLHEVHRGDPQAAGPARRHLR